MENQINVGDQNAQQIGQNPINQSAQIPERPKIQYWIISSVLLFIVFLGICGWFIRRLNNKNKVSPSLQSTTKFEEIINKLPLTKTYSTFLMAFIRDGDVWIAKIDGSERTKLTAHPQVKYPQQHPAGGTVPQTIDVSNEFHKLPKLSFDGKYLAYLSFSQNSLKKLDEREKRIATESSEIKKNGYSEIFTSSGLEYELVLYDINNHQNIVTTSYNTNPEDLTGDFNSIIWARNKNLLAFIKDYSLHTIVEMENQKEKPLVHSISVKNFCGLNCNMLSNMDQLIKLTPDGTKVLSSYEFYNVPQSCNNTGGDLLKIVNFVTKSISKQSAKPEICNANVGDWYNDNENFINYDYRLGTHAFYKSNYANLDLEEKLFDEENYPQNGPVMLSPDNKWVAYPLGYWTFGSSGKVDLRIRNLGTKEYLDLLETTNKALGVNKNRIFYPKWDFNSNFIYFELGEDDDKKEKLIVRFDVTNKKPEILISNAEQVDVN